MWPMIASMAERRRPSRLHAEDAALLTGDEDAARIGGVAAAIALIDAGALDRAAGQLLRIVDDGAEGVPVVRVARRRLGVQHQLATWGVRGLDAELTGRARFALADAFDLGNPRKYGMAGSATSEMLHCGNTTRK